MENVSAKLKEIFNEINNALESLTEVVKRSPKEIIGISKIIERGEKRIDKEYTKRIEEMKNLQIEIEALTEFASKMGYTLTGTEATEETEQPTEPEQPEQKSGGIKIVIGSGEPNE